MWLSLTLLSYFCASLLLYSGRAKKQQLGKRLFFYFTVLGLVSHALFLHQAIDSTQLQNLAFKNMLACVLWFTLLLLIGYALRYSSQMLLLTILLPANIASVLLIAFYPDTLLTNTAANPKILAHIVLAMLTLSVISVAALEALLLAHKNWQLQRSQQLTLPNNSISVEKIEQLLFCSLLAGFCLLSLLLLSSFLLFHQRLMADLLAKTTLAVSCWVIFAVLLIGRYGFGWRGNKAIYSTLLGFVLLIIIYFGSELLLG